MVGAIAVKRQVVLGRHDCMNRVDVVRAIASGVLGGLQAHIRHHPILNLVNKIIELSRLSDVELWIIVIECRADDEIGCNPYLIRRRWSDFVGRPGTRAGRWRKNFNLQRYLK